MSLGHRWRKDGDGNGSYYKDSPTETKPIKLVWWLRQQPWKRIILYKLDLFHHNTKSRLMSITIICRTTEPEI